MYEPNAATMRRYLDQLVEGGDFADIPMRDDVRFTGPLASSATAVEYRSICEGFADAVRAVSVRTMVGNDDVIHVVYDLDMGLAGGPLPTSQTVEFIDGAFSTVEVIFDAAAIVGATS